MDKALVGSKKEHLFAYLKSLDTLLVAFSGGVDSAFLLAAAQEALGGRAMAATAFSPIHPQRETQEAAAFARAMGVEHVVFPSHELQLDAFVSNGPDRCYHCKRELFRSLSEMASKKGIRHIAHGANTDDLSDYRPGLKAAQEAGILAPLIHARLNKAEIRLLSKEMELLTWDRRASPCLATRIPYGSPITGKKLTMIEEAEAFLEKQGIREVRVRHYGDLAKIEMDWKAHTKLMDKSEQKGLLDAFRRIGFEHVALDLEGYMSGKMNRSLVEEENTP